MPVNLEDGRHAWGFAFCAGAASFDDGPAGTRASSAAKSSAPSVTAPGVQSGPIISRAGAPRAGRESPNRPTPRGRVSRPARGSALRPPAVIAVPHLERRQARRGVARDPIVDGEQARMRERRDPAGPRDGRDDLADAGAAARDERRLAVAQQAVERVSAIGGVAGRDERVGDERTADAPAAGGRGRRQQAHRRRSRNPAPAAARRSRARARTRASALHLEKAIELLIVGGRRSSPGRARRARPRRP